MRNVPWRYACSMHATHMHIGHVDLQAFHASHVRDLAPHLTGDFEEPWYWASYGRKLFEYSFYSSRYRALHMAEDKEAAATAAASVPKHVIGEFLWRRDRNFNATRQLLLHGSKQATA